MSILTRMLGQEDPYENLKTLAGGQGGMPMSWPMQPGQEQVAELAKLGVHMPELQQNTLFPKLAQNHPLLGGLLQGAVLGAALTPPPTGPEGVGGGISRAAQGIMAVPQFQRQEQMAQMMAPIQMQGHIQQLQAAQQQQQVSEAYRQMLEAQTGDIKQRPEIAQLKMESQEAIKNAQEQGKLVGFYPEQDTGIMHMITREPGAPGGIKETVLGKAETAGRQIQRPKQAGVGRFMSGGKVDENQVIKYAAMRGAKINPDKPEEATPEQMD